MRRAISKYRDYPFYYLMYSGRWQSMISATGFYSLPQFPPSFIMSATILLTKSRT
jgi:hypothetical protein